MSPNKVSKYNEYNSEIIKLYEAGTLKGVIAKTIKEKYNLPENTEAIRWHVRKVLAKIDLQKTHPALIEQCENVGVDAANVKHYWHKGKHFSLFVKPEQVTFEQIKDEIITEMEQHAPNYKKLKHIEKEDGYLLVIDPADIHLNKLCSEFETGDQCDHDVIYKRVIDGISGIIDKSKGYQIDKILFVGGNDILHVDNPRNTTTSGTPQDVSMMWYDAFTMARKLMVECLETLIPIAPVHFVYNPSNHDYTHGFFLAQTIQAWFRNCDHVTFDVSIAHRKYFTYYNNLIGTTHGDGAKGNDLAMLMANEAGEGWYKCKRKYIYTHHIHHKTAKDYMGVSMESIRSVSGTDSWHHKQGFQHAPKAIEGFIHSQQHGQVCRFTHYF